MTILRNVIPGYYNSKLNTPYKYLKLQKDGKPCIE